MVTANGVLWKKVFGNKVLSFGNIKVLWKKVLKIKSYQFQDLFSRTFFSCSSMISYKKVSGKSPLIRKNAWEQSMFTTMEKRGWIPGYIQYADCRCIEVNSFLWNRLRLDLIFPRLTTFFLIFFFGYIFFRT